jgi:CHAT domain-containing protein
VATVLRNLATLLQTRGDYAGADPLLRRALAIRERVFGSDHPDVAESLDDLAELLQAEGDYAGALPLRARASAIEDTRASALLATGSDRQKQAFFATLSATTSRALSFHLQTQPESAGARDLALRTLLRRKGLTLDAGADMMRALAASAAPEDKARLQQLADKRSELGTLTFGGPGPKESVDAFATRVRALEGEADELERQLAARYAEVQVIHEPPTVEAIRQAIPAGAVLVEIVQYAPFDARAKPSDRSGKPRYAAYVVPAQGAPGFADLGLAQPIDALVARFRTALSEDSSDVATQGRALDDAVMRPIRALLGDSSDVLLSPDGALNLIPFAALVDERGHFLVERYRFTYLTSGRDLLRFGQRTTPRSPPLVLGAPDYGPLSSTVADNDRGVAQVDLTKIRFPPLPGTRAEATAVAPLLAGAHLLEGPAATEAAVKTVHGPSIMHLATHGFFLVPTEADERAATRGVLVASGPADAGPLPTNPLLRSGLAFAGANIRRGDGDDGILTALDVAGLDLRGTRLVVLSACETGVGDVKTGDGVYGLRRALVLAGSESQVMSLWKVNDEATRGLMTDYYRRLEAGGGRSDALRETQLAMLGDPRTSHPYFWAAFLTAGQETTLDGNAPPPVRVASGTSADDAARAMRVHGSACGCEVPGGGATGGSTGLGAALAMAFAARGRSRRRLPTSHRTPPLLRASSDLLPCLRSSTRPQLRGLVFPDATPRRQPPGRPDAQLPVCSD